MRATGPQHQRDRLTGIKPVTHQVFLSGPSVGPDNKRDIARQNGTLACTLFSDPVTDRQRRKMAVPGQQTRRGLVFQP
ncbi:hypothetical protein FD644_23090 [Serratia fonticola]|uniref:hypothetical protein n=1 Tax=Serratia fonticola TaxID=47917 RepID=UPI0010CCC605|nr:hypothetical protein [Serratia fonticola]QCR63046.1 hypothetical protein FD644_23090 [Serratia fonticola]